MDSHKTYRVTIEAEVGECSFEITGTVVPSPWVFCTKIQLPDGQTIDFAPAFKFTEV